jgi:2-oxoglutarate ferredoxin oxidoreductase subunit delta
MEAARTSMAAPESSPAKGIHRKPKTPPRIELKVSWCKGCGLCVDYCNLGVLEMNGTLPEVVKIEKCSRCMQCETICPDFAIRVTEPPEAPDAEAQGEEGA